MMQCVRDSALSKYNTLQPFQETRQKPHKPCCFNFSSRFYVLLFDFSPASFSDRPHLLIKLLEAAMHSYEEKRCSVKFQGGPLDHNPRKTPLEDSWLIILQDNSKCLLLTGKQIPQEMLFRLFDETQNTRESKERKY